MLIGSSEARPPFELGFLMERVTGIEPASRAWEPSNDALVQGLTCGQMWSWVTLVDRH
jgi:hypothetical protein